MSQMLHEVEEAKYVIKANGVIVSIPFNSKILAEQHIENLPQDLRSIAEVVPVTPDGKEILFG